MRLARAGRGTPELARLEADAVRRLVAGPPAVGGHVGEGETPVDPHDDAALPADIARAARVAGGMRVHDAHRAADREARSAAGRAGSGRRSSDVGRDSGKRPPARAWSSSRVTMPRSTSSVAMPVSQCS